MFRKLTALLPVVTCLLVATDASAVTLDPYGSGVDDTDWDAPKIAPSSHCKSLQLYLADVPAIPTAVRRYRFTGECTINVAREGKVAKMRTLPVVINSEYSPGMKRASETVIIQDPDFGTTLSTWATCSSDPFVGTNVACTNKGMGANKWNKFISKEDAPFTRQRATESQVALAVQHWADARQRGAAAGSFYDTSKLAGVPPVAKQFLGESSVIFVNVQGGSGYCPAEIDFGDGKKEPIILWSPNTGPFQHQIEHRYAAKGFYKIQVQARPGCTGDALVYALVK